MESVRLDKERGQILVQVALMVVVLFAFVALALDVGHVYAGRRRMQNAADAGALAGAREICFGGHDTIAAAHTAAEVAALDYAIDRNGAQTATVGLPEDYTVVVTAAQTLDTFFAGFIGINTADVRAEAAAMCGGAKSASYLWPLAFEYDTYDQDIECGEDFWVFVNDPDPDPDADPVCAGEECECDPEMDEENECYERCDCTGIGSSHIASDYRGWVRFDDPAEGVEAECEAGQGANSLKCWIENPYPGEIEYADCARSEPGASISVKQAVNRQIGEGAGIILWGDGCEDEQHKSYFVEDFGCIQLLEYWGPEDKIPQCGDPKKNCKHDHIIKAKKLCSSDTDEDLQDLYDAYCSAVFGSTGGNPADDLQYRSASLIQWPRPPAEE